MQLLGGNHRTRIMRHNQVCVHYYCGVVEGEGDVEIVAVIPPGIDPLSAMVVTFA